MKNPTIKEVAALAGVSPATVGRVVGEYGSVRPETRDKVTQIIHQLGFNPNAVARSLKCKHTKTLGYLVPTIANLFYAQVAKGIQDVSSIFGYNLILCSTDTNSQRTYEFGRMLLENQVAGAIIYLPTDDTVYQLVETLKNKGVPVVLCGNRTIPEVDRVLTDDFKGGFLAAKHLLDLGHHKVGFINVKDSTTSSLRRDGYLQAFQEAGVDNDHMFIKNVVDYSEGAGYTGVKLLLMQPELPTAIIVANDIMAMGAMNAIDEANLNVPKDISIIGFDNAFAVYMRPKLTTVALPAFQIGQISAELVLERIEKRYHGEPRNIILSEELIIGGSTTVVKK